ncbi:UNVERIFIED_CONTAM: hypothetical protein Sradi_6444100 [Sesamum radiatum]|uniref:Uncharacterized protein n=1 Tax=Sesamum radiatum TaxID=300843 RepID=A0AAW2K709_SESRA
MVLMQPGRVILLLLTKVSLMMDDIHLEYYKFCGDARYKPSRGARPTLKEVPYAVLRYLSLTPPLQRLYWTTVDHMTWHATHQTKEGSMCHPSDGEAWKHLDRMYPDFAEEPHNVRLGLYTNGFALHGQYDRIVHVGPLSVKSSS